MNIADTTSTVWNQIGYAINDGEWIRIGYDPTSPIILKNVNTIKFANAISGFVSGIPDPENLVIKNVDTIRVQGQSQPIAITADTTFNLETESNRPPIEIEEL